MRACVVAAVAVSVCVPASSYATVVALQASKDNTLFEEQGSYSNGAGSSLFCGETSVGAKRRSLIAFDLSSIPAGSVINSAMLTMRMSRTSTGSEIVSLHLSLADWGEGASNSNSMGGGGGTLATSEDATWTHRRFGGATWTTPGGDFRLDPSVSIGVGGTGFYQFTGSGVSADVQAWVNNPASNAGWFILGNESTNQTAKRWDSREAATVANRPVLTIDYTVPTAGSMAALLLGLGAGVGRRRMR
ncbi:MAG: DNRLRE domain-containing protein [Planctomycetes bacterium]|nr:DNRLRE domain-containing protein [Planctomycetota bacterium]